MLDDDQLLTAGILEINISLDDVLIVVDYVCEDLAVFFFSS